MNKYSYEYYKKDKLTGDVLDYNEATIKEKSFNNVFDCVMIKHFLKDKMAKSNCYYHVHVTMMETYDNIDFPYEQKSKIYINGMESFIF